MPILDTPGRKLAAAAAVLLAIAAVVAGVLVITGGGGSDDTPEAAVRGTVEDFVGALADQDYGAACGLLTEELRTQLGGAQCEQALVALAGQGATPPTVEITEVRVAGNKAAVDATISSGSAAPAQHSLGSRRGRANGADLEFRG